MKDPEKLRWVKADLHLHFGPYSKDSSASAEEIVERIAAERRAERKIGCIAVTNHNTAEGPQEIADIAKRRGVDLIVIPGQEVTTGEDNFGGKKIELLAYFSAKTIPSGLSIEETMKVIKDQGAVVGIPHPFELWRHGAGTNAINIVRCAEKMSVPILWEVFNARSRPVNNQNSKDAYKAIDQKSNILPSAGSDTHFAAEVGRAGMVIRLASQTPTREEFLSGLSDAHPFGNDSYPRTVLYRTLNKAKLLSRKLSH